MNPGAVSAPYPRELTQLEQGMNAGADTRAEARAALTRAVEKLRSLEHGDGWWKGELETNVTMDAEDVLLREFLGVRESTETERSAAWIRSEQREDGSWANF